LTSLILINRAEKVSRISFSFLISAFSSDMLQKRKI